MTDTDLNGGGFLDELSAWAQKPFAQTGTIPSAVYTSDAFLQLEIEHLFKRQWICVGRVDQVAKPGDYFSFDIAGYPIIVVRDDDDEIKALSNVCRHRGTVLVSGAGTSRAFACPYHAWTYDLDGALRAAPYMDRTANFDQASVRLPQYRVELWHGFIYVNLDQKAAPFAADVAGLDALFNEYQVADMRFAFRGTLDVACNWKVQVENFCESYHVFQVHPRTVAPVATTASVQLRAGGPGFNHHTQGPPEGFCRSATRRASLSRHRAPQSVQSHLRVSRTHHRAGCRNNILAVRTAQWGRSLRRKLCRRHTHRDGWWGDQRRGSSAG